MACFKILAYYLFPATYGFTNHSFLIDEGYSLRDLTQLYWLDFLSWLSWSIGLAVTLSLVKSYCPALPNSTKLNLVTEANAKIVCLL